MRPFNNYDQVREAARFEGLPKDGYELIIKGCSLFKWDDQKRVHDVTGTNEIPDYIEIYVDIAAGQFCDYYAKNYRAQTSEDKRWRGFLKLYFPREDGSEKDQWTKNSFARNMNAIEDSNNGYRWTWNEASLKGLCVGGLFRNEEYKKQDGTIGKTVKLAQFCDIKKIRDRTFKLPDDKLLKEDTAPTQMNTGFMSIPEGFDNDALPFK